MVVAALALTAVLAGVARPAGAQTGAGGSADLSVAVTHSPSAPVAGDDVTFTVTAANDGPGTAADVVVGLSLGYSWMHQEGLDERCGFGGEQPAVICALGTVAPGTSTSVTFEVVPQAPGVFVLPAAVASNTPDPDTADRATTATVIVQRGPSRTERAVAAVYGQVLGRSASDSEVAYWAGRWESAEWNERDQVPLAIITSPESSRRRVGAAYPALLGRPATASDLAYWAGALAGGRSFEDFEAAVIGSPEFARRHGPGSAGVVQATFGYLLGRPATASEEGAWTARLAGGSSHGEVAAELQRTNEARNRVVDARVRLVLDRASVDFDRWVWHGALHRGSTHDAQWAELYTGNEFLERFPYDYGYGY